MNHTQIKVNLDALRDNVLPSAEAGEVAEHLKSCKACRESVTQWEKIKTAFLRTPEVIPSEDFVLQVMEKIEAKRAFDIFSFIRWAIPTVALMGAALFLISVWPMTSDGAVATELAAIQLDINGDWLEVEL
jgi:anti-sigma factor RsiW